MVASVGAAAWASKSTLWVVNLELRTFAVVSLETLTEDFVSGGRKTVLAGSKSFRPNVQSVLVSSRKTGFCPAVTSGRKFVRGCQARLLVGEVYCETPMNASSSDHLPLAALYITDSRLSNSRGVSEKKPSTLGTASSRLTFAQ